MENFSRAFVKLPDGGWFCKEVATLESQSGSIRITPGTTWKRGKLFMGVDIAQWLDDYAHNRSLPPGGWRSPAKGETD